MENVKFIDGQFTPTEAKEILLNMISSKIQFHRIKEFSSEIRDGKPAINSQQRIKELQEAREKIITLMKDAENQNQMIDLQSTVNISYTAKNEVEKI
ncbi:hypothetical protein RM549_03325 [Salegentibacter sp. F188]|uniref:Uncharacterized protein n=1 Tax=Autumnicola patrickiae TaxID=3075591 RepID=A0ABU3E0J5_9FLAO|nr:hypothetical protein [Salegentibacter sp. F188]MDT0688797.1 hypothetical protein [Salegentibacter sp. F188]